MLSGCGDSARTPLKMPEPIPVATVACSQANTVFSTAGSVVADTRMTVASRFSAYVRAVHFKEGDAVKKGDVLVELDSRDIEAVKSAALGKVTAARAAGLNTVPGMRMLVAQMDVIFKFLFNQTVTGADKQACIEELCNYLGVPSNF